MVYASSGEPMLEVIEDSRYEQSDFVNRQYAARPYYESDAEDIHIEILVRVAITLTLTLTLIGGNSQRFV